MRLPWAMKVYERSTTEEKAHSLSHAIGAVAAVVFGPILVYHAWKSGSAAGAAGCVVFSISMFVLYASSAFYHGLPEGKWKDFVLKLDHGAIFLLIGGTYAPFGFQDLSTRGLVISVLVALFALTGLVLTVKRKLENAVLAIGMYVAMGWVATTGAWPLVAAGDPAGRYWLVAGGAFYTFGTLFYALGERIRYFHLIWHCFVLAGTAGHSAAIWVSF